MRAPASLRRSDCFRNDACRYVKRRIFHPRDIAFSEIQRITAFDRFVIFEIPLHLLLPRHFPCVCNAVFFRRSSWAGRFFCALFSLPGLPYGICRLFARLTETLQPCISVRADLSDIPVDLILSIAPLICFRISKRQRLQARLAQLRRDLCAYRLQPLCGSTGILPIEYRKLARRI